MTPEDIAKLPYRPCVGVMLMNPGGEVFVGQRLDSEIAAWQMPQGGVEKGEDPQGAALRELWEETGLRLQPGERLATFDTGFHVYRCDRDANSGEIDPPLRLEIRQAFYLPLAEFDSWQWRFPGQAELVRDLLTAVLPEVPATPASRPVAPGPD